MQVVDVGYYLVGVRNLLRRAHLPLERDKGLRLIATTSYNMLLRIYRGGSSCSCSVATGLISLVSTIPSTLETSN